MIPPQIIDTFRVSPGQKVKLKKFATRWDGNDELAALGEEEVKERARQILQENLKNLADVQERLYADDRHSLLIVLQAMDAAGKDGTIKHVMSGINPQGCQIYSFKQPSSEELDHTYLWRCQKRTPERGRIGIFNRSYYEDVLVVRVHPELLEKQKLPEGKRGKSFWRARYDDINNFERHLARNGTIVLKFFLHVSKAEQKKRFLERIDNPEKNWKFSHADVAERAHWDEYIRAYEDAIAATSTKWAPWYIVPADQKWVTRTVVGDVITSALMNLGLQYPTVSDEQRQQLAEARAKLEAE
jgi:PPK2 family polyphosphate:nucleotide phosphotransferase